MCKVKRSYRLQLVKRCVMWEGGGLGAAGNVKWFSCWVDGVFDKHHWAELIPSKSGVCSVCRLEASVKGELLSMFWTVESGGGQHCSASCSITRAIDPFPPYVKYSGTMLLHSSTRVSPFGLTCYWVSDFDIQYLKNIKSQNPRCGT